MFSGRGHLTVSMSPTPMITINSASGISGVSGANTNYLIAERKASQKILASIICNNLSAMLQECNAHAGWEGQD